MIKVRTWIMEQTSREDQRTLYRSEGTARISIHKRNALFLIIGRKKEPHIIEEDSIGHLLSLNLRLPPLTHGGNSEMKNCVDFDYWRKRGKRGYRVKVLWLRRVQQVMKAAWAVHLRDTVPSDGRTSHELMEPRSISLGPSSDHQFRTLSHTFKQRS